MQFASPPSGNRTLGVLPLLGISLLPTVLLLAVICVSLGGESQLIRLPRGTLARPPQTRDTPTISLQLSREGIVTVAGQATAPEALPAAWQREQAALRLLGCEPAQATVVIRADAEASTGQVQRLMETAQAAGFARCVLRPAIVVPASAGILEKFRLKPGLQAQAVESLSPLPENGP